MPYLIIKTDIVIVGCPGSTLEITEGSIMIQNKTSGEPTKVKIF